MSWKRTVLVCAIVISSFATLAAKTFTNGDDGGCWQQYVAESQAIVADFESCVVGSWFWFAGPEICEAIYIMQAEFAFYRLVRCVFDMQ